LIGNREHGWEIKDKDRRRLVKKEGKAGTGYVREMRKVGQEG
jgi:hypothetical protein